MKNGRRLLITIKLSGVSKNEIRCCSCGKKLAEGQIKDGNISIQCKCGVLNEVTATPEKKVKVPAPEKVEYPTDWGARKFIRAKENY
jgi:phage FluMu protein Com